MSKRSNLAVEYFLSVSLNTIRDIERTDRRDQVTVFARARTILSANGFRRFNENVNINVHIKRENENENISNNARLRAIRRVRRFEFSEKNYRPLDDGSIPARSADSRNSNSPPIFKRRGSTRCSKSIGEFALPFSPTSQITTTHVDVRRSRKFSSSRDSRVNLNFCHSRERGVTRIEITR